MHDSIRCSWLPSNGQLSRYVMLLSIAPLPIFPYQRQWRVTWHFNSRPTSLLTHKPDHSFLSVVCHMCSTPQKDRNMTFHHFPSLSITSGYQFPSISWYLIHLFPSPSYIYFHQFPIFLWRVQNIGPYRNHRSVLTTPTEDHPIAAKKRFLEAWWLSPCGLSQL